MMMRLMLFTSVAAGAIYGRTVSADMAQVREKTRKRTHIHGCGVNDTAAPVFAGCSALLTD